MSPSDDSFSPFSGKRQNQDNAKYQRGIALETRGAQRVRVSTSDIACLSYLELRTHTTSQRDGQK
jgi:hypothetical protein